MEDTGRIAKLRETFRAEAQEHVQTIASGLIALERAAPADAASALVPVFRAAHSLKGAARAVRIDSIESTCQSLEGVLAALQRQRVAPSAELFDLLHRAARMLELLLRSMDGAVAPSAQMLSALREELRAATANAAAGTPPEPAGAAAGKTRAAVQASVGGTGADSVRVHRRTIDRAVLRAEELLYAKNAATQRALALRQLHQRPAQWRRRWASVRADLRLLEPLMHGQEAPDATTRAAWQRLRDCVESGHDFTIALEADLLRASRAAEQEQRAVGTMVELLLDDMKQMALQPFATVLDLLGPSVRELARERGKEVDLALTGADVEIDRRVLDEIKDPLIQLVRNAIDHGIESPAQRRAQGKPARGRLAIDVLAREGHQVEVVVADDGAGIDAAALLGAAEAAGLRTGTVASPQDLLALACEAGVSTRAHATDLSGRGMGLAIVKHQVQRLNGSLSLDSAAGRGTTIRMKLPVTLARLRVVLLRVGQALFAIPTRHVERVTRSSIEAISTIENRPTLRIEARAVALCDLARLLGLPPADAQARQFPSIVVGTGDESLALRVCEVLDEREVLLKPLGPPLTQLPHIAGACVLAHGQLVPVLNTSELMRAALREGRSDDDPRPPAPVPRGDTAKAVLVAEDSITSRTMLKGILEAAGYRVETAADGIDAFGALRGGGFDVLVTDVDMPRLNGFDLTARVRADRMLADLPVVLVTALDSMADREHGIDVGANAYIVKSSFDERRLLDTLERLV